jgi:type IV secretory pathway component VirB8|nr:MAG TPA: hypothetical protein [Caudoviricetes sp.]
MAVIVVNGKKLDTQDELNKFDQLMKQFNRQFQSNKRLMETYETSGIKQLVQECDAELEAYEKKITQSNKEEFKQKILKEGVAAATTFDHETLEGDLAVLRFEYKLDNKNKSFTFWKVVFRMNLKGRGYQVNFRKQSINKIEE